LIQIL